MPPPPGRSRKLRPAVEDLGMPKCGVEFVSPQHERPVLFMNPQNILRAKEAVMSVPAGDIFSRTPFRPSLRFFQAVYCVQSLLHLRRSWSAWRGRRERVRDLGVLPGESIAAEAR